MQGLFCPRCSISLTSCSAFSHGRQQGMASSCNLHWYWVRWNWVGRGRFALDLKEFGLTAKPMDGQYHVSAFSDHLPGCLDAMKEEPTRFHK